ncbi:MAG: peptidoglycan-binding protein [Oscillospiraceae bacterium]|jgi:peptidoglycan hydrolase-like protein with peptidoglycan-binding domain|nr:peptidoglycan-binding protein [Oscillospiraceae bacterium]
MATGTLRIEAKTANSLPIQDVDVVIRNEQGELLQRLKTDENGKTSVVSLETPEASHTLDPDDEGPFSSQCYVSLIHAGYISVEYRGVHVYDGIESVVSANMRPLPRDHDPSATITVESLPPVVSGRGPWERPRQQRGPQDLRVLTEVVVPEFIMVHLGRPDVSARNVHISFVDYIKNVASSEIYATWPQASLEANIYAQITFALNRVYTEWYRSRGYPFDITNSTAFDQAFVNDREIYDNISRIVDGIFNRYARRLGFKNPYFTEYCDGRTVTCPGMSQWGTVTLAERGMNALEILRNYYPKDLEIVETDNITGIPSSYPGTPLQEGSEGPNVEVLQRYLNRIRTDFPLIPQISYPRGNFDAQTAQAVRVFQGIFDLTPDGVVGPRTWYKISFLYVAVTKLSELTGEGERIGIGSVPPTTVLQQGSRGAGVNEVQFILNMISEFFPSIPPVIQDSLFGATTRAAVIDFQRMMGLTPDGIVGPNTWRSFYNVYWGISDNVFLRPPEEEPPAGRPVYPGTLLRVGSRGDSVHLMQRYLNAIAERYHGLPTITADGAFGNATQNAVIAFQRRYGLSVDGVIGHETWNRIVSVYFDGESVPPAPPYPGYYISVGSQGGYVRLIQERLNALNRVHPAIARVPVDGVFGSRTRSAVVAFQRQFALSQDGIVGRTTWIRLMAESAGLTV